MQKQLLFCFFVTGTLSAGAKPYNDIASLEGGLQTLVDGKVSAISRELVLAETDIILPSIHPIELNRFYIRPAEKWGMRDPFWRMNYFGYGERTGNNEYQGFKATDDNGTFIQSTIRNEELGRWVPITNDFTRGETNIGRGAPSGKNNLGNTRFKLVKGEGVTLRYGSGAEKHFSKELAEKFLCTPETASYLALSDIHYINGFNTRIRIVSPTSFNLTNHAPNGTQLCRLLYDSMHNDVFKKQEEPYYIIYADDGRHVRYDYRLKKQDKKWCGLLKKVSGISTPTVSYEYDNSEIERLVKRTDSEGGYYEIDYYEPNVVTHFKGYHWEKNEWTDLEINTKKDKWYHHAVKSIKVPSGKMNGLVTTHRFLYPRKNRTDVYDCGYHLTSYFCDANYRPTKIIYWDGISKNYKEDIIDETTWQESFLKSRTITDSKNPLRKKGKQYHYDAFGNVDEETTFGNLTGHGQEAYIKKCAYDSLHNLKKEIHPNGMTIEFDYEDGTDRLKAKRVVGLSEKTYRYNDFGSLIEEIETSEGCTLIKRHKPKLSFPCFGFPEETEELYNGVLLKKTTFEYHRTGQLKRRDTNGIVEIWDDFDAYDHPQTEITRTGEVIRRTYDSLGNILEETGPHPEFKKTFKYDKMYRLTKKTEEFKGKTKTYEYTYDALGRLEKYRDPYFRETCYVPDRYGRTIAIHHPDGSKEYIDYDAFNNPIRKTDRLNHVTESEYTYYDKPYWIKYPDDSTEHFTYDLSGNLVQFISKSGAVTTYHYDLYNRLYLKEEETELGILKESTTYIGCQINTITDASDTVRTFQYDGAGRKIAETYDRVTIRYDYDTMGRLYKTTYPEGSKVEIFDAADRVEASWWEDPDGTRHDERTFRYDPFGNVHKETIGGSTTYYEYDPWGRLLKKTDPLGYETRYLYEETTFLTLREVDGETGYQTVEIYDAMGRVEKRQKLDFLSNILQEVKIFYDMAGNKKEEQHGQKVIRWDYNKMGKVIFEAEQDRNTTTHYNLLGEKEYVIKPDGTKVIYDYYITGRLKCVKCPDCHYVYAYDPLGRIQSITDPIHHMGVERAYSPRGNLEKETYRGFTFTYTYDGLDRPKEITFPDDTSVRYTYNISKMCEIERGNYKHLYTRFDPQGNVTEETLVDGTTRTRSYNLLNRLTEQMHPLFSLCSLKYDSWGCLKERTIQGVEQKFEYDPLQQLIKEADKSYSYDNRYNRILKNGQSHQVNLFDQVESNGVETFRYDLNGNLKERILDGEKTIYTYDGLDRLIAVETGGQTTHYYYDGFNRRLLKDREAYWYLDQNEVGRVVNGKVVEFRVLGLGHGAEIGASVALELNGEVYVPHHDQAGHLIGIHRGSFQEYYKYSAFGEHLPHGLSPWRFASKRLDPETGFLYFGRRYYDPSLGRFITRDPSGYSDGVNLYAYVHNRPLTHFDLYGLWDLLEGIYQFAGTLVGGLMAGVNTILPQNTLSPLPYDYSGNTPYFIPYGDKVHPNCRVTGSGGINNGPDDSFGFAPRLSAMCSGSQVNFIHNGSCGIITDMWRWFNETFRNRYSPVSQLLAEDWEMYLGSNPAGYIYHYCHSEGVAVTKQSLELLPENLRNRIVILAVAPGCYIPKDLSENVTYLVSKHDVIHRLDTVGFYQNQDRMVYLDAHPSASLFDHNSSSKTFFFACQQHYRNFEREYL